jgi:glycosyltransferase involved in cell wall biosynthesis
MTYNESASLRDTVIEIQSVLHDIGCPYEILLIDDGSTDGSLEIAEDLAQSSEHTQLIAHEVNRGLGGVYRTGFDNAGCDYITFFPADGQFPAAIIQQFYPHMENVDMVLGYLVNRDASSIVRLLSLGERWLYKLMFGGFPRFQGITMFRQEICDRYTLKSGGRSWTIMMELILRAYKDREIKTISLRTDMRRREHGSSKVVHFRTISHSLKELVLLRMRY